QQIGVASAQGAHVGEIESRGAPAGLTGRVTIQLAAHAGRGEILASRLVADLAVSSGLHFVDRGRVDIDELEEPLALVLAMSERHLEPACRPKTRATEPACLTTRESEVVSLIADGKSNAAIAAELRLSEHTVKRHVANILLKLDLPSRAAAAAFSIRHAGPDGP
ncbi:MAG: response regulator transcription factor, partial [Mesorhizobium sp.]